MSDAFLPESDPAFATDPEWEAAVRALAARPEDAALVALVNAHAARAAARAALAVDTEAALARVRAQIAADGRAAMAVARGGQPPRAVGRQGTAVGRPTGSHRRWWLTGAAAAAIAAAVGLFQWRTSGAPAAMTAYRTAVGVTDSLRLPDGSLVVLAPGSTMTLAQGFGDGARTVDLAGAAFFEVTHDATRPFVVRVNGVEVRDLGTAFSVRTGVSGTVSVAVTHGIVALRPAGATQQAELHAGDQGTVTKQAVTVRRGVVTEAEVSWTRGLMQYRDTPLDEVRADLQRWYGITVRIDDAALARRTLTAAFRADTAAQAIRLIALAIGAEPEARGDTVLLRPVATPGTTPSASGPARLP